MNGSPIKLHEILANECRVLDRMEDMSGTTAQIRILEMEGREEEGPKSPVRDCGEAFSW